MSQQQYAQTKALQEQYEWEQSQLPPYSQDDYLECLYSHHEAEQLDQIERVEHGNS